MFGTCGIRIQVRWHKHIRYAVTCLNHTRLLRVRPEPHEYRALPHPPGAGRCNKLASPSISAYYALAQTNPPRQEFRKYVPLAGLCPRPSHFQWHHPIGRTSCFPRKLDLCIVVSGVCFSEGPNVAGLWVPTRVTVSCSIAGSEPLAAITPFM
jgi:hypothetical protein